MTNQNLQYREETDSLGTVSVPEQSLYGSNTVRALENFPIDDRVLGQEPDLVQSLARIKKACALANMNMGNIDQNIGSAFDCSGRSQPEAGRLPMDWKKLKDY